MRDLSAVTGIPITALQTWVQRGHMRLSGRARWPGRGRVRMYTGLDALRIAVAKRFIDMGRAHRVVWRAVSSLTAAKLTTNEIFGICQDGSSILFTDGKDIFQHLPLMIVVLQSVVPGTIERLEALP